MYRKARGVYLRMCMDEHACGVPNKPPSKVDFSVSHVVNRHTGPQRKMIVAISLFGNWNDHNFHSQYYEPLLRELRSGTTLWPEVRPRVYLDPRLEPYGVADTLAAEHVEVFVMRQPSWGVSGAMWRFLVLGEVVDFWCDESDMFMLKTSPYRHYIRKWSTDAKHPSFLRVQRFPWLGALAAGSWGAKNVTGRALVPDIQQRMERFVESGCCCYGCDELFLTKIWNGGVLPGENSTLATVRLDYSKIIAIVVGGPTFVYFLTKNIPLGVVITLCVLFTTNVWTCHDPKDDVCNVRGYIPPQ